MANLLDVKIIDDGVYLFELQPLKVKLNKPLYTGMVCLDLAKHFMVSYHYKMVDHFGRDKIQLLYTDTDSFVYLTYVDNLYHSLLPLKEDFDFSSYHQDHPLYNTHNKSKRGKWKDEVKNQIIEEAVFLRSKCYAIKMTKDSNIPGPKVVAGVTKTAQKHISYQDYKNTLLESRMMYVKQRRFGSENHQIYTYEGSKIALNYFDDKRYQSNKIETLPYGHYLLDF